MRKNVNAEKVNQYARFTIQFIDNVMVGQLGTAELADDAVIADKVADNQIGVDALTPYLPGTML